MVGVVVWLHGLGDSGAGSNPFDSHIIFAAAYPVRMPDDSIRVYYMGGASSPLPLCRIV